MSRCETNSHYMMSSTSTPLNRLPPPSIEQTKADRYDLMILDVGLPDMDGREACKVLRKAGFQGTDHHADGERLGTPT